MAMMVAVAAAVIPAAALTLRAIARWPAAPVVELSVVGTLAAVAAVTIAGLRAVPLPPWVVALSMIAWIVLLLIFPTGRPTNAPLTVVALLAAAAVVVAESWSPLRPVAPVAFIAAFGAMCAGQIWRYRRRSSIPERQSTKWLVLGLLPAIGIFIGVGLIAQLPAADPAVFEDPRYLVASTAAMWLVPLAAAAGIVIGDRGPVDELVRIGISVVGTALVAAATYVAVLGAAGPGAAAAAACLVVLPAGWSFLRIGTALAYSRGPQRPLAALPARLGSAPDPAQVGDAVARTVQEALGVPVVHVLVHGELLAARGSGGRPSERIDVEFGGAAVAELRVGPRPAEPGLTRRDRLILDRIVEAAAPALRGADAAREAQLARSRLETTRADERRRLHADLHDELGPALAGLGFTATAAARTVRDRPGDAIRMLESIESGTQALVRRVREISYDLRPEEVVGQGLEAILVERLRTGDDDLEVRFRCEPVPDELVPDILRIAQEGVTNVRRHAAAMTCEVTVRVDGSGCVWITVTDDGVGAGPQAPEGIGLPSIRRRVQRRGGRVDFTTSPRGSTLTAVLGPVGASP